MNIIKGIFPFIIISFSLLIIIACKSPTESSEYKDVEVEIIDHYTQSVEVIIKYSVENTGSKTINGWHVYFLVSFNIGPDFTISHQTSKQILPGEKTEILTAREQINALRRTAMETTLAKLKRIVTH